MKTDKIILMVSFNECNPYDCELINSENESQSGLIQRLRAGKTVNKVFELQGRKFVRCKFDRLISLTKYNTELNCLLTGITV